MIWCERPVEEDLAVIDHDDAIAQLLDVLHVMARQHRHDAVLAIVDAEELAHALLADDVESDRRLVEEEHASAHG